MSVSLLNHDEKPKLVTYTQYRDDDSDFEDAEEIEPHSSVEQKAATPVSIIKSEVDIPSTRT